MSHSPYKGVFSAAVTALKDDMSPDLDLMAEHCKWLLANGCDGLAILGTTGEANSFGLKERISIIEGLVERGIPGDVLMPGTGCCAAVDTINLTQAAINAGAKGVLMLPPFYYKNMSDQGLFDAFAQVIDTIADDRLKIYLYHFPQMSGVPISYELIEMLLKAYPETVVGMKDSSGVFENMVGAAEKFPGFAVFSGADDLMLPLLRRGGAGCITAAANVSAFMNSAVYNGWMAHGDTPEVEAAHETLSAMRKAVSGYPLPPALKALTARNTGNAGWNNLRPPFVALSDADRQALFDAFDAVGTPIPAAA
ncbi:MAG: dihydrodipicolinate synthase family protein [Rhodospirillales bacterium]|nr:dihydrodipicolinate synthase family protein [Rhodospirillales bacterium]MBO6788424.1 dihydrodipicolinate synthase family protein [Rhodospirillales bacterium]